MVAAQGGCIDPAAAETYAEIRDATFLYFSGADIWRDGGFLHGGLLWSPEGIEREGFTLKAFVGGGRYRSHSFGAVDVTGRAVSVFVMPGWRFKRGSLEATVFAGLDAQYHQLSPDDPSARLRGGKLGLRGAFDLWYEPSANTMLAADASVSTVGSTYSARSAAGWHIPDWFYVGPEAQVFVCDDFRQYRLGLHLTGFKTIASEWAVAVGQAWDSNRRSGAYGRISVVMRQ
jgi:hypothetical protein